MKDGWFRRRWIFAFDETREPETKGQADLLWDEEEKNIRDLSSEERIPRDGRSAFISSLSLYQNPPSACLPSADSDADQEIATLLSCMLLPSMRCILRQPEIVTDG
jgi:hypothetical protein